MTVDEEAMPTHVPQIRLVGHWQNVLIPLLSVCDPRVAFVKVVAI